MTAVKSPSFDAPDLARRIEQLPDAAIDALPFGAIHLDAKGWVVFYSEAEARLSGRGPLPAKGRHFFTEIAPCFAVGGVLARIEDAQSKGRLDIELGYIGDFDDAEKELRFRIQSASDGGIWLLIQRV